MEQNQMCYLTGTNFVAAYKLYQNWEDAKPAIPKQYAITDKQFYSDNALFGTILQTTQGNDHRYITMFERTKDGIGLWI
jgi:hypothetical protein